MAGVVPKDEFCGLAKNIISKPKIEELKNWNCLIHSNQV